MDIIDAVKARRSINFFETGQTIPDERIKELLAIANLCPSSFNLQPWKVVAVKTPERKKALRKCAMDQAKVEEAGCVLIMVASPGALEENVGRMLDSWQELGYMKPGAREGYRKMIDSLYGAPESQKRKFFAVKNTSLFAMSIMLTAKGLGLETHAMDGFDEEAIKKEFNIQAEGIIPMLIAVGDIRKGITLLPRAFRRDVGEFTRFE